MLSLSSVSNPLLLLLLFNSPIHVNITYLVGFIVYEWLIVFKCDIWADFGSQREILLTYLKIN